MKTRLLAIAAIASLSLAPTALASDKFEFDFDFSPVEVSTEAGAEKAYTELEQMIEDQCEPNTVREKIHNRAATERCVSITIEQAVADIDEPNLTAVHKAKRG